MIGIPSRLGSLLLCLVAAVGASSSGKQGTAKIEGRLLNLDKSPFNITTKITLNHFQHSTYSRADGRFTIYDVSPGIHILSVLSNTFHFPEVKLQVLEGDLEHPKCIEYAYPGSTKQQTAYPLELHALGVYEYFEKRSTFSIFGMLRNPMVLMTLVSLSLMFLMPKMMEGLDPEEKERMKRQMEMQRDPSKMLGQMWTDLSGASAETPKRKGGTRAINN